MLQCPTCAFVWSKRDPLWDEHGACGRCGALITGDLELRVLRDDELGEMAPEDRATVKAHAAYQIAVRLHKEAPCPECARPGASASYTSLCDNEWEAPLAPAKFYEALVSSGAVPIGACQHCQTPLAVVRGEQHVLSLRRR